MESIVRTRYERKREAAWLCFFRFVFFAVLLFRFSLLVVLAF